MAEPGLKYWLKYMAAGNGTHNVLTSSISGLHLLKGVICVSGLKNI